MHPTPLHYNSAPPSSPLQKAAADRFDIDLTDPLRHNPAAVPTPHPSSPVANPPLFSDPKFSQALLVDYVAGLTASRLCSNYNISLPQLFAWRRSPETQAMLAEHEEFAAAQTRQVQHDKEPEIILTLCAIATRGSSESESRRAASDLLRAFKLREYLDARQQRKSRDKSDPSTPSPDPNATPSPSRDGPSSSSSHSAFRTPHSELPPQSEIHNPKSEIPTDPRKAKTTAPSIDAPDLTARIHIPKSPQSLRAPSIAPPEPPAPTTSKEVPPSYVPSDPSVLSDPCPSSAFPIPHSQFPRSSRSALRAPSSALPLASESGPLKICDLPFASPSSQSAIPNPQSEIEAALLTPPAHVSPNSPPEPDPLPGFPNCLEPHYLTLPPYFPDMCRFMPLPEKTFNPFWSESDIFYQCFPGRTDKHHLRMAIASHQEMLTRRGAQALIDQRHFDPSQQTHQAYSAAVEFYQEYARKNPPPDH